MGFFKRLKKHLGFAAKILDPVGGKMLDKKLNPKSKAPPGATPEDYQGELNSELDKYSHVNENASKGVLDDSKAAGTYADTPAAQIQRQGEADAEARYGHRASLERINSLQKSLGIPVTPADQLPATPTTAAQAPTTDPAAGSALPAPPADPNAPKLPAPAVPKPVIAPTF